jgi:arylsulfatase A-like enzyme
LSGRTASFTGAAREAILSPPISRCSVPGASQFSQENALSRNRRPNIVITLSDDQNPFAVSGLGNSEIRTPAMDRLMDRGTTFRHAYHGGCTIHAVCCPSRAMLFTGRQLFQIPNVMKGWWEEGCERFEAPNPDIACTPMLGELLRRAGYHCFGTGKWHNMPVTFNRNFNDGAAIYWCGGNPIQRYLRNKPSTPQGRFGRMRPEEMLKGGHWNKPLTEYDAAGEWHEFLTYVEPRHTTDAFTEAAVDFIDAYDDDKPFFIYVPYTAPHGPTQAPREWHEQYPADSITLPANHCPMHPFDNGGLFVADWLAREHTISEESCRQRIADHYAITAHMDAGIGRIHEALERNGLTDNTIVIHSGDHGKAEGHHGLTGKQSLYEEAATVPMIVAGPGIDGGSISDALVYQHDLFPTLLEAAGADVPPGTWYRSLWDHLAGRGGAERRRYIQSSYIDSQRMVRDERYKLIEYNVRGQRYTQLYDLVEDPDEIRDLSSDPLRLDDLQRLRGEMRRWQEEVGDPCEILSPGQ